MTDTHEYRPGLATVDLVAEVRRLLAAERTIERLICRYLADLADRVRQREDNALHAYVDEFHAARCFFGLGVRNTRERVRVGRALRQLPQIEGAFVAGEVSYSRVREVTRVAEARTESIWLELARTLDMRSLERRVAAARAADQERELDRGDDVDRIGAGNQRMDRPVSVAWLSQNQLRATFELSAEAWALIERALEGARRCGAGSMSDAEALAAVARDAILAQTENPDASDPRCSVVVYECQSCGKSELDTGMGLLELEPATAAAIACGASEIELASEGRAVQRGGPLPAAVRRAVMLRDHCRCRVPGCNRRRYVDVHHLAPQASGGEHSRNNCLVLCTTHHRLLHEGKVDVTGDAEGELCFRDARGGPIAEAILDTVAPLAHPDAGELPGGDCLLSESQAAVTTHLGSSHDATERLLHVIGRRGGWSMDALVESSGLSASRVAGALTLLELCGRVRSHDFAFHPV